MNIRSNKNFKIYNLNDEALNADRAFILEHIAKKLKEYYSQYINFPMEFWIKLVTDRLASKPDGVPFTLVAFNETLDGKKQFLGTISAERGCAELNDKDNVWICGLYVEDFFRKQGLGLALCKEILEKFKILNISTFRLWSVDKKLNELYAYAGTKELNRPNVLGHEIIVSTGETEVILKNFQKINNTKNNHNYSVPNHSLLFQIPNQKMSITPQIMPLKPI